MFLLDFGKTYSDTIQFKTYQKKHTNTHLLQNLYDNK